MADENKKSNPLPVFILGTMIAGAFFALLFWAKTNIDSRDQALAIAEMQTDFEFQSAFVRTTPDDSKYGEEVRQLLSRYFRKLDETYKAQGKTVDLNWWVNKWDAEKASGKMDEKKAAKEDDFKAAYNLSRDLFEKMRDGEYYPVKTFGAGGIRLDVLKIAVEEFEGQKVIAWDYALWGAYGSSACAFQAAMYTKEMLERLAKDKALAEAAAQKGEEVQKTADMKVGEKRTDTLSMSMTGTCDPVLGVAQPSDYVKEFPPHVQIGKLVLPMLPNETEQFDLTFTFKRAGLTGSYSLPWELKNLAIDASWKLPPGQWKAEEKKIETVEYE